MSIFPRKFHGPELKCGGPQMCSDCMERIAQESALNFGDPEHCYCGVCGLKLLPGELFAHLIANPKGECGDA